MEKKRLSRENEINQEKIKRNWMKIKKINDILKNTEQVISEFKEYIKNKNKDKEE